jgi:signal peptidase I
MPAVTTAMEKPKSHASSLVETVAGLVVMVGLALLIQAFVVKPYRIPSNSMEPTLIVGQHILVNRLAMDFSEPHVGGIYVFHPPDDAEQQLCGLKPHEVKPGGAACGMPEPREASVNFVKRLVAGPGDDIYIKDGHVFRKAAGTSQFVAEKDSYIAPCQESSECNFPTPIKIPPGHWFMMGDNRGESNDSRFWGPVPTGWIIGQAIFTYWPAHRIGTL